MLVVLMVAVAVVVMTPSVASAQMEVNLEWFAGSGDQATLPHLHDGNAADARMYQPQSSAMSLDGTLLYVADRGNGAIRSVNTTTGYITTVALVSDPKDIAVGPDGSLYVTSGSTSITAQIPIPSARIDAPGPDKVIRVAPGRQRQRFRNRILRSMGYRRRRGRNGLGFRQNVDVWHSGGLQR